MQFEVGKVKSGKTLDRRSGRSKDVAYGKKEKMAAMAILAWQEELGASMATSGVTLWAKWHQNNQHVRNDSGRSGMDRKRGNTWPSGSPPPTPPNLRTYVTKSTSPFNSVLVRVK